MKSRTFRLNSLKPWSQQRVLKRLFLRGQSCNLTGDREKDLVPFHKKRRQSFLSFFFSSLYSGQVIDSVLNKRPTRHQQVNGGCCFKYFRRKRTEGFSQFFHMNSIKQAVGRNFGSDTFFLVFSPSIANHNVTVCTDYEEGREPLDGTFAFICKLIASGSCRHEQCNGSGNSGRDSCYGIPIKQACEGCPPVPPGHKPIWNHIQLSNVERTVAIKGAA